jgi:hypothetical protein
LVFSSSHLFPRRATIPSLLGDDIDLAAQGAAFTREERAIFGLEGMIPYEIHDLTKQSVHQVKASESGFGGLT